jgi:exodeoxyribonuclease-3
VCSSDLGAWIEKDLRARDKPSDHVPVWVELRP